MKRAGIQPALLVREYSQVTRDKAGSFSAKLLAASQLQAFQKTIINSLLHFGATEWVSRLADTEGTQPNPHHLAPPETQHMLWPSA